MQQVVLDVVRRASVPGIIVVEAPMGEGKTEAALAAAEVLAHRSGAGGLFIGLPTTATSDAMFARVRRWAERLPSSSAGERISLELAHGRAALNDEARRLPRTGATTSVGADAEKGEPSTLGVVADQWLHGRKKTALLASVVVGTVDQVLLSALKSKHLVLRHLGLAGKVVIIDEVHAVDAFMGSYLQRALHWLGAHGSPVILLSATLASTQRRSLVAAYAAGASGTEPIGAEALSSLIGYPAVTSWSPEGVAVDVVPDDGARRQRVELHRLDDGDDALVALLTGALADGGCAAVVRNTVGRAQATYELLRDRLAASLGCEVVLLHSRFVAVDRAARERDLAERLGPPAAQAGSGRGRPERIVVVGTQVIEQSLDVDLDLMVTDLAPVDLVLQRLGRLHRHQRGHQQEERPAGLRTPRCYVTGVEDWTACPPRAVRGSRIVYRDAPLLRALAVLAAPLAEGSITVPDDIAPLVERAYADDLAVPEGWEQAFADAEKDQQEHRAKQESDASTFQLPPPGPLGTSLVGWVARGAGEADDSGRSAGQVRDTQESVEVVLVQRVDGQTRLLPSPGSDRGAVIETEWRPDDRLARAAAACTVQLPVQLSNPGAAGRTVAELERAFHPGWQQSPWLSGLLVLELDENLSTTLADHRVTYDRDRGLRVARED